MGRECARAGFGCHDGATRRWKEDIPPATSPATKCVSSSSLESLFFMFLCVFSCRDLFFRCSHSGGLLPPFSRRWARVFRFLVVFLPCSAYILLLYFTYFLIYARPQFRFFQVCILDVAWMAQLPSFSRVWARVFCLMVVKKFLFLVFLLFVFVDSWCCWKLL